VHAQQLAVDHIDPQWKEGRDYQLVCGLDNKMNHRLSDRSENARKTNRFVPYRVDPRLAVHQEPGDLGFFLIKGTWKLVKFLGLEWWEESNRIGNSHTKGWEAGGKKARSAGGRAQPREVRVAGAKKAGSITSSQKWKCLVTGHTTNAGALTRFQKKRNIDTSKRVRV